MGVGMLERGRDVLGHRNHAFESIRGMLIQTLALDQLHDNVGRPFNLTSIVHRHDVGVIELGHCLRFAQQARAPLRAEAGLVHQLDRHVPIEHRVMSAIHDAHAAAAQLIAKLIAVVEYGYLVSFCHRVVS